MAQPRILDHLRPSTLVEMANDLSDSIADGAEESPEEFQALWENFLVIEAELICHHGEPFTDQVRQPIAATMH